MTLPSFPSYSYQELLVLKAYELAFENLNLRKRKKEKNKGVIVSGRLRKAKSVQFVFLCFDASNGHPNKVQVWFMYLIIVSKILLLLASVVITASVRV